MAMTAYEATAKTSLAPQVPTFATSVEYAGERVDMLVQRLDQLANRLCGTIPEDAANRAPRSVPNGLFDEVMSRASDIATRADVGIEFLNRIERSLP